MRRRIVISLMLSLPVCLGLWLGLWIRGWAVVEASSSTQEGSLQIINPEGQVAGLCPLKHTDVKAEISGFLARVIVTQEFENPSAEKIEAVYTFPLPQNAAVDDMTMRVGDRTVRGRIKRREEARAIYDAARAAGNVASLLDQERPNIFTQSVANIMPGERVTITISYVETLSYEDGTYSFVFPMVVGPRYIPGSPAGKQGGGWAPDTDRVPDASRITPHVAPKGTRAGHDISLEVALDAGVPIDSLKSVLHEVEIERPTNHSAVVRLKDKAVIPNRDFILKYDVAGRKIEDAVLTHHSGRGGFFTMILQPPERVTAADVTPKELVFVLDTSGSMSGFPIEKAKETMKLAFDGLYPQDTFNLITFAGDTHILFPEPLPATRENLNKAQAFLASRSGGGGTEMMKAIQAALDPSDAADHLRIVCFMTDGYVGNDMEIVSEVQKHPNARVFAFGIGSSVNRFLLDKMAEQGRGEVEYVTPSDDGSAAARRFHERVRNPLLTDISIDWGGLPVADVYPTRAQDLFSAKPVVLSGRYSGSGRGVIKLKGRTAAGDFVREIAVELPATEARHDVLATLWARTRVGDLMSRDYKGVQQGNSREDVREAITQLGLEFRLMTQFTSFVAVEEMTVTDGGEPRRIEVPVDMPEGVSHQGVFGDERRELPNTGRVTQPLAYLSPGVAPAPAPKSPTTVTRARKDKSGVGTGSGGGMGSGSGSGAGPGSGGVVGGVPGGVPGGSPSSRIAAEQLGLANRQLTPEEQKRQQLIAKLHPSIAAVVDRLTKKISEPTAGEARFVRNGKAEVQVWLADKSSETMAALKQLGFEIVLDPKTAKMVIGRVAIEKIEALAELKAVRYIAPMTSN
ncbi:MAG TPA: VIT and VWA domain-containing protein [Blastocatellia bacterium]|nr:VIT and VWA domain-containing protein [Blastocatellia bacterium]